MNKNILIIILAILLAIFGVLLWNQNNNNNQPKTNHKNSKQEKQNKGNTTSTDQKQLLDKYLTRIPNWCLDRANQDDKNWQTLQSGQFKIKYPKDFKIKNKNYNYANFVSTQKDIQFGVFSPLWAAETQEVVSKLATGFNIEQQKSEKKTLSCSTEIGSNTIQTNSVYLLKSQNQIEKTLMVEINLKDAKTGSETNRFFVLKIQETDNFTNYQNQFIEFINSLEQYADA